MAAAGAARAGGAVAALWRVFRNSRRSQGPGVTETLSAFLRMLPARFTGIYAGASLPRLFAMAAALGYVLSPVDFMPEAFLLIFGLADDALVLTWLAGAVLDEGDAFWSWERSRGKVSSSRFRKHTKQKADAPVIDGELIDHTR